MCCSEASSKKDYYPVVRIGAGGIFASSCSTSIFKPMPCYSWILFPAYDSAKVLGIEEATALPVNDLSATTKQDPLGGLL